MTTWITIGSRCFRLDDLIKTIYFFGNFNSGLNLSSYPSMVRRKSSEFVRIADGYEAQNAEQKYVLNRNYSCPKIRCLRDLKVKNGGC